MIERIRVVHVDDDPGAARMTADYLELEGEEFEVLTETDPAAALERLDEHVDCIVSDYGMAEMDGIELLRTVRRRRPDSPIPFVLFTGRGSEEIAAEALNAGATSYVQKGDADTYAYLAERIRRDVTAARTEVRSDRYGAVIDTLDDPVYVLDERGRFVTVNDAFVDLVGYDRDRLLGSEPHLIKSEGSVATAEANLGQVLSSDGPDSVTFEVTIQPKDGDPVPCEDHMGALPYEGEQFRGSVGVLRDVSERKHRERELERQNERLAEFTSIVSHDLRNPLEVLLSALELAEETGDPEHFRRARETIDRMDRLIEDLLTLARDGATVGMIEPVDLNWLVRQCWAEVATEEATLDVDTDLVLLADEDRLRQVIENLLANAIDHAGPAVGVTIGDLRDGPGFYVADDGPGIPAEDRERVFEADFSTAADGTGFGLPIVTRIAEAHGWTVRAAESETGGARFEIRGVERVE